MKKYMTLALLVGATTIASGREPILVPTVAQGTGVVHQSDYSPSAADELVPVPVGSPVGVVICDSCDAGAIELYRNVRVVQSRKIHPCAISKIVQVPNPCYDPCNPCGESPCVFVEICIPPCACERICSSRNGRRTKFDYGRYAVKVTARRGTLIINYDS